RLGVNHASIPVNAPKCPVHSYHRDGQMRVDGNYGATVSYQPNMYDEWADSKDTAEPPLELQGALDNYEPKDDQTDDCFYQAGDLYRLMAADKKDLLIENTARNIESCTDNIKYRHAAHCYLADPDYGEKITKAMGLDTEKAVAFSKLSHDELMDATSAANWK
ncbi:MAG: catalase, partial [Clostridiales Family XIII bacterium]|nr:catalase [Clostridiales Family XIII bacterium]